MLFSLGFEIDVKRPKKGEKIFECSIDSLKTYIKGEECPLKDRKVNVKRIIAFQMEETIHHKHFVVSKRFEKLELMLGKKIAYELYDSSQYESGFPEFYEKVSKQDNIAIIIEDSEGNVFGGYVPGKLPLKSSIFLNENCCLFSLNSNRRYSDQAIFPLKEYLNCGFRLCDEEDDCLCQFGVVDVVINKNRTGSVKQCSFYYDKNIERLWKGY